LACPTGNELTVASFNFELRIFDINQPLLQAIAQNNARIVDQYCVKAAAIAGQQGNFAAIVKS
jgi:hypothetical protein